MNITIHLHAAWWFWPLIIGLVVGFVGGILACAAWAAASLQSINI